MTSRALIALALVPAVLADESRDAARAVAIELADGKVTGEQAAQRWGAAGLSPEQAHELVRALPLEPDAPTGDHELELEDGYGTKTDLQVRFGKDGPDARGRWGVMILLHGIGGSSKQGLEIASDMLPPHSILLAPSAKETSGEWKAEDLRTSSQHGFDLGKRFRQWWIYSSHGFPMRALWKIARRYPLDTDRVVLVGYSMGGFGTWNIGLRYHERFAGLAPLAGGIAREEFALGKDEYCRALLDNAAGVSCFFVHGSADEVVPCTFDQWSRDDLEARQVRGWTYREVKDGKHVLKEFLAGDALKDEVKQWLWSRRRDPHPARIVHRMINTDHYGAYWLRVDGLTAFPARVVAEVPKKKNVIRVTTEGVSKLTVYLDPELIDVDKKVTLEVDGKVLWKNKVVPSLQAVGESFGRSRDPVLSYAHAITVDVEARAPKKD